MLIAQRQKQILRETQIVFLTRLKGLSVSYDFEKEILAKIRKLLAILYFEYVIAHHLLI